MSMYPFSWKFESTESDSWGFWMGEDCLDAALLLYIVEKSGFQTLPYPERLFYIQIMSKTILDSILRLENDCAICLVPTYPRLVNSWE